MDSDSSAGPRVLVVDDVQQMRDLIRRVLAGCGYRVDTAATLGEAHRLRPATYDAVLVDLSLGDEQGTDLVAALLAEDPDAARRCLVITGGGTAAVPPSVARLAKPFRIADLVRAVRELPGAPAETTAAPVVPAAQALPVAPVPVPSSAGPDQAWQLLDLVRRLREQERLALADFLHDGPIQELAAACLELELLGRSPADGAVPALDASLKRLDLAARSLRWLVDERWPFPATPTGLAAAVAERTSWLVTAPVIMDPAHLPAGLAARDAAGIVDVIELALVALLPAIPSARPQVRVRAQEDLIGIELVLGRGAQAADPVMGRAAVDGLVGGLGVVAEAEFGDLEWRIRLQLARPRA